MPISGYEDGHGLCEEWWGRNLAKQKKARKQTKLSRIKNTRIKVNNQRRSIHNR